MRLSSLVLALVLLSGTAAGYQVLFERTISSGSQFEAYNTTYILYSGNKVKIELDNQSYFINNQSCMDFRFIKLCVNDTEESSADITVFSTIPLVFFNFTAVNTTAWVNEEVGLPIYFNNTGGSSAIVRFRMDIPLDVEILDLDGLSLSGRQVKWTGEVRPDAYKFFNLTFRPKRQYNYTFEPEVEYFNGMSTITLSEEEETETKYFFNTTLRTNVSALHPGNGTQFTVYVTNLYGYGNISVTADMTFPDQLAFGQISHGSRREFRWKENIHPEDNSTMNQSVMLYAVQGEDAVVLVELEVENEDGLVEEMAVSKTISIEPIPLEITGVIDSWVATGVPQRIKLDLTNPYQDISIRNLVSRIDTPIMAVPTTYYNTIRPGQTVGLMNEIVTLSDTGQNFTYPITMSLSCETEYGEVLSQNFTSFIRVVTPEPKEIIILDNQSQPPVAEDNETEEEDISGEENATEVLEDKVAEEANISNETEGPTPDAVVADETPNWKYVVFGALMVVFLLAVDYANDLRKEQKSLNSGKQK